MRHFWLACPEPDNGLQPTPYSARSGFRQQLKAGVILKIARPFSCLLVSLGTWQLGALDARAQILEYHGKYLHQKGGNMTALLEQALAAIEKLPADAQDAIAIRLLAEVADEHAWAERFETTTDAQWDCSAAS